jgi:phosphoribosyl-dephospho-CoA transferase
MHVLVSEDIPVDECAMWLWWQWQLSVAECWGEHALIPVPHDTLSRHERVTVVQHNQKPTCFHRRAVQYACMLLNSAGGIQNASANHLIFDKGVAFIHSSCTSAVENTSCWEI